ncbi:hypothetical protein [Sulfoacidibacillus ferrooxidans]|uniref:Uncharacterized protein n=1 Tax=Sulfoacidibacillus ferrooxidans TaxID=2005001 RepID=A0A9X1VEZ1_9BACL|nr:hypothetical protein [Sulfoacidibacillus ferrooxidans]MCI0184903.1 hypothetical protein [Sulfoacidibacillus ferrooxidans]
MANVPSTHARHERPWFLPPIWLVLIITIVGTYGTGVVYHSLTTDDWNGSIGGILALLFAVLLLGTPLGMARYLQWIAKQNNKKRRTHP